MKRSVWSLGISAALGFGASLLGGCRMEGEGAHALQKPFELRIQQTELIGSEGLRVTFDALESDSRCPVDVQCVWAGEVRIGLRIQKAAERETRLSLTSPGAETKRFDGYTIQLLAVSPYPRSTEPIPPESYVVRLVVTKR